MLLREGGEAYKKGGAQVHAVPGRQAEGPGYVKD